MGHRLVAMFDVDEDCVVCLECLRHGATTVLACGHVLHAQCALDWEKTSGPEGGCPTCRQPMGPLRLECDQQLSSATGTSAPHVDDEGDLYVASGSVPSVPSGGGEDEGDLYVAQSSAVPSEPVPLAAAAEARVEPVAESLPEDTESLRERRRAARCEMERRLMEEGWRDAQQAARPASARAVIRGTSARPATEATSIFGNRGRHEAVRGRRRSSSARAEPRRRPSLAQPSERRTTRPSSASSVQCPTTTRPASASSVQRPRSVPRPASAASVQRPATTRPASASSVQRPATTRPASA